MCLSCHWYLYDKICVQLPEFTVYTERALQKSTSNVHELSPSKGADRLLASASGHNTQQAKESSETGGSLHICTFNIFRFDSLKNSKEEKSIKVTISQ